MALLVGMGIASEDIAHHVFRHIPDGGIIDSSDGEFNGGGIANMVRLGQYEEFEAFSGFNGNRI